MVRPVSSSSRPVEGPAASTSLGRSTPLRGPGDSLRSEEDQVCALAPVLESLCERIQSLVTAFITWLQNLSFFQGLRESFASEEASSPVGTGGRDAMVGRVSGALEGASRSVEAAPVVPVEAVFTRWPEERYETRELTLHYTQLTGLDQIDPQLQDDNKRFAYQLLTENRRRWDAPIPYTRCEMSDVQSGGISQMCLGAAPPTFVGTVRGGFEYTDRVLVLGENGQRDFLSGEGCMHWYPNFGDPAIFGYCGLPNLAQDELQVLEHPLLAHARRGFSEEQSRLGDRVVALFEAVPRYGRFDTMTPVSFEGSEHPRSLYGGAFCYAPHSAIAQRLERLEPPTLSNLFVFAAPYAGQPNTPYTKPNLEALFYTAYTAFAGIKARYPSTPIAIHGGNWGAGAFGHDACVSHMIQLAAAKIVGLPLFMHPMGQMEEFNQARQWLDDWTRANPTGTIDQFLDGMTQAEFRYGWGNGT